MYIGRNNIYGVFEKQVLDIQVGINEYYLSWQAGSASSLLVVTNGQILEPGVDYNLVLDGKTVIFTTVPNPLVRTYVVYLGRELTVPRTLGIEPRLERFVGTSSDQDFTLSIGPVNSDSIIVFVDGVQKKNVDDFTITGTLLHFIIAPSLSSDISVYIHGVERFDSGLLTDDCILPQHIHDDAVITSKIADGAVSWQKLSFVWVPWVPVLETFGGMTIVSSSIDKAVYMRQDDKHIKIKLDFTCVFGGTVDNRVRYSLPLSPTEDEICPAAINLSTLGFLESGIQMWGGQANFDIQRQNGINYTLGESWRFKIRAEYDIE
jgi:hypothetical protein